MRSIVECTMCGDKVTRQESTTCDICGRLVCIDCQTEFVGCHDSLQDTCEIDVCLSCERKGYPNKVKWEARGR